MAATPSPAAESGALGERDLFRGSLGVLASAYSALTHGEGGTSMQVSAKASDVLTRWEVGGSI